jgi:hypothetical protein
VFPVRYELNFYILFRGNLFFIVLSRPSKIELSHARFQL